jgi:hypothetical protein
VAISFDNESKGNPSTRLGCGSVTKAKDSDANEISMLEKDVFSSKIKCTELLDLSIYFEVLQNQNETQSSKVSCSF